MSSKNQVHGGSQYIHTYWTEPVTDHLWFDWNLWKCNGVSNLLTVDWSLNVVPQWSYISRNAGSTGVSDQKPPSSLVSNNIWNLITVFSPFSFTRFMNWLNQTCYCLYHKEVWVQDPNERNCYKNMEYILVTLTFNENVFPFPERMPPCYGFGDSDV